MPDVSNSTGHMNPSVLRRASWAVLIALVLWLACTACSPPVIKQYQKDGVQFSYYSNWKIVKDAPIVAKPDVRSIQIEGPSHAVISLICEPPSSLQSLEQFASGVAARRGDIIESKLSIGSMKTAQVSKGTSIPTTGKVAGRDRTGYLQEFSIELLGQQVPHQARFFLVEGAKYKIMIMSQVSNDNAASTQAGFELILSTLATDGIQ